MYTLMAFIILLQQIPYKNSYLAHAFPGMKRTVNMYYMNAGFGLMGEPAEHTTISISRTGHMETVLVWLANYKDIGVAQPSLIREGRATPECVSKLESLSTRFFHLAGRISQKSLLTRKTQNKAHLVSALSSRKCKYKKDGAYAVLVLEGRLTDIYNISIHRGGSGAPLPPS